MGRTSGAILVLVVAIGLLWMAATGRLNNLAAAWAAIRGAPAPTSASPTSASGSGVSPANLLSWLPPLGFPSSGNAPVIPPVTNTIPTGNYGGSNAVDAVGAGVGAGLGDLLGSLV
jgi:hypothetical protein